MDDSLTILTDLQIQFFLLLQDLLPSIHGALKLIHHGVEGGVSTCRPLETLSDAELLAADLVQY